MLLRCELEPEVLPEDPVEPLAPLIEGILEVEVVEN
jgi:hypothetical protein